MDFFKLVDENDNANLRHQCRAMRAIKSEIIESVDRYGNTPLLRACYLGRHESAHVLLKYGRANIRAINYFGQNALTLAAYSGNYDLVVELLHYRSYDDFNLSSMIPALMVAIMQRHRRLIAYFRSLDKNCGEGLRTVHGLSPSDVANVFKQTCNNPQHQNKHQQQHQQQQQQQQHRQQQQQKQCQHVCAHRSH